jgi:hypothetical protein
LCVFGGAGINILLKGRILWILMKTSEVLVENSESVRSDFLPPTVIDIQWFSDDAGLQA